MSTWMIVEDNQDIRDMVLAISTALGSRAFAFGTGDQAISYIDNVDNDQANGELPQLAILDLRLQGPVGGMAITERLRQSPRLKNIAIVVMTAYPLPQVEERRILNDIGADHILYKPLPKLADLKAVLKTVIASRG